MSIQGQSYINGQWVVPTSGKFSSWNPVTDSAIAEVSSCTREDVETAANAAAAAMPMLRAKSTDDIAKLLNAIADEIEALGSELIETGMAETGLPEARLLGERGRTCGQIRAFANLVADGSYLQASIDLAQPDRQPLPKPDIRACFQPLGPIAVFGASNFPFAFGCLGGDTAAALAAGNAVVAKGHPSHPQTSSLFAKATATAIEKCDFPTATFSLLQGSGHELGTALVEHEAIKAVGFTGSLGGGRALMDIAAKRATPIPVYAEMGSVNPVFVMPDALDNNLDDIAAGLAGSIVMGTGQFCTSPGLVVTLKSELAEKTAAHLSEQPQGVMLNPGIASALNSGIQERLGNSKVELLTGGLAKETPLKPCNSLMKVSAETFLSDHELLEELFGPVSLVVECDSVTQMQAVAEHIQGNLTATIHTQAFDDDAVKSLLAVLSTTTGRVLFNGYPTGVEVCPSMVHGGPYPASSSATATSVGTAAINRFVSRVAYQNCPDSLLPAALKNDNPLGIWRLVDGEFSQTTV